MSSIAYEQARDERIEWLESMPFFAMHVVPFLAIFTGVRPIDVVLCVALYYVRIFFITAGYHRYFAHRAYKLNRFMQFLVAFGGTTAVQKGVLWWAGLHRDHHRYSDTALDVHSPKHGFYWSHMGWILSGKHKKTPYENIQDFAKYPELRWLNKWYLVPPVLLGIAVFLIGGWSALLIGFVLSTVLLWHGTFTINSLAHVFGRRRYVTTDTSRNSLLLSLITAGEGWHNNHHHYQSSVRLGFFWWEVDVGYYVLKAMSWLGLARDLRKPPAAALKRNLVTDGYWDVGLLGEKPAAVGPDLPRRESLPAAPPEPSPS
jgi:stearoyl-CoA desaturase (delta-9 desaturase)